MRCPNCGIKVNVGRQIMLWEDEFGDDIYLDEDSSVEIDIVCQFCDEVIFTAYIETPDFDDEPLEALEEKRKKLLN